MELFIEQNVKGSVDIVSYFQRPTTSPYRIIHATYMNEEYAQKAIEHRKEEFLKAHRKYLTTQKTLYQMVETIQKQKELEERNNEKHMD